MRYLWLIAFMLVSCVTINAPTSSPQTLQDVYSNNYTRTAGKLSLRLIADDSVVPLGSAYSYRGKLISASHVCQSAENLFVRGIAKPKLILSFLVNNTLMTVEDIEIQAMDEPNDICLLSGTNPLPDLKPGDKPNVGDIVHIIGFPMGFGPSQTTGRVIDQYNLKPHIPIAALRNRMVTTATAAPGSSGGPILDAYGNLIGMLIIGFPAYEHVTVGVVLDKINRFIDLVE